jgi:hypothetical protein
MLTEADDVLKAAAELHEPVVVWDTSKGSAKSLFWLVDLSTSSRGPGITRELFNSMRVSGALDCDPESRKKIDRYQAWPVKV